MKSILKITNRLDLLDDEFKKKHSKEIEEINALDLKYSSSSSRWITVEQRFVMNSNIIKGVSIGLGTILLLLTLYNQSLSRNQICLCLIYLLVNILLTRSKLI